MDYCCNRMMLVAPQVSHANWEYAVFRTPALDPWHLAQALIANSPLPLETVLLVDSSLVNPYYKQLVYAAQTGGISMHTIYQSELSQLYGRAARAAYDAASLSQGDTELIDDAIAIVDESDLYSKEKLLVGLFQVKGDMTAAYTIIDSMRTALPDDGYWKVQGLLADLQRQSQEPSDVDANGIALLQQVAADEKVGCGEAQAWLMMLGEEYTEPIILPTTEKRLKPESNSNRSFVWHPLAVFPNPSKGPLTVVYEVPDAVADAHIKVMNSLGQLVLQQQVRGQGLVQLDLSRVHTGLLVIGLYYDGHLIGTEKAQIVR